MTGITIAEFERSGISVELFGEFDTCALERLREALNDSSSSGLSACVDLSGVTFLDVRCCTRDSAAGCRSYGDRLASFSSITP